MRRVLLAIAGTIAGLLALLSFKTHPAESTTALPSATLPATSSSGTPSATSTATGSTSTVAPAASASPSTSSAAATVDYTGQAVQTRYGIVQVKVTIRAHTITDVSFVQLTSDDPRSEEINSEAGPTLLQQTLAAQSAQIDGVSGATYTSQGYEQSLQSALDQAGL